MTFEHGQITNHKFQIPNKFQALISNDRNDSVWNLVIGTYLSFGAWYLVLPQGSNTYSCR
jgi:hypothetical protein